LIDIRIRALSDIIYLAESGWCRMSAILPEQISGAVSGYALFNIQHAAVCLSALQCAFSFLAG